MKIISFGACAAIVIVAVACAGCGHESAAESLPAQAIAVPAIEPAAKPEATEPVAIEAAAAPVEVAAVPSAETPKPAAPIGQRPPADRGPSRPGEAEKITFDDLNLGMQADMVFRPFLLNDRVKELDGQRVSILGYIHGGVESARGIKEFVLLKNTECKFGPGGQADHLARVYLEPGKTTEFTKKPVKIEGKLVVDIFEGVDKNTWAVYRLDDAKIVR